MQERDVGVGISDILGIVAILSSKVEMTFGGKLGGY
jgi:hypothetical protein